MRPCHSGVGYLCNLLSKWLTAKKICYSIVRETVYFIRKSRVLSQKEDTNIENYILLGCQECSRLVNRLKALAEDSKNE